jgi:hypothetical protein
MPQSVVTLSRAPLRSQDLTCQIREMIDSRKAADEMHSVRITGPVQMGGGGGVFTTDDDRQPAR